jgi:translocation and assembly module TamB
MVKRSLISLIIIVFVLLGCCLGSHWLLYTKAGSSWLIKRVVTSAGGQIQEIEGTLIGHLHLTGLTLTQAETRLACGNFELDTTLKSLFPLQINIEHLGASELSVNHQPTASASSPLTIEHWPESPWWLKWVDITFEQIDIKQIAYQQADTDVQVDDLNGNISWIDNQLRVPQFTLQTIDYKFFVTLNASFDQATAQLEMRAIKRMSQQELYLKTTLQMANKYVLTGPVNFSLKDSQGLLLTGQSKIGIKGNRLNIERLDVNSERYAGHFIITAELNFLSINNKINAHIELTELLLQPALEIPIKLSGEVNLKGAWEQYQGDFKLSNRVTEPFSGQLEGVFLGNSHQIQINNLIGSWLQGTLTGQVHTDWQQNWQLSADITGRGLNPQQFDERLTGNLNFQLNTMLRDTSEEIDGQLHVVLNESQLLDQTLRGQLTVNLQQRHFDILGFNLSGQGFNLRGQGSLENQLDLFWQIDDLQPLFPQYHGALQGSGQLSLSPHGINSNFNSHVQLLQFKDLTLANGEVQGEISASDLIHLDISGHDLRIGQTESAIEQLQFLIDGSLQQHNIKFQARQSDSQIIAQLTGGWDQHQWQGHLNQLHLKVTHGEDWQSETTPELLFSSQQLQLGSLLLTGQSGGTFQLQGQYFPELKQGEGQVHWQDLDLSQFDSWLTGIELSGISSGDLNLHPQHSGFKAQAAWHGTLKFKDQSFNVTHAAWQSEWTDQGLAGQLRLDLADGGYCRVALTSEEGFALQLPQQLHVQLQAHSLTLGSITPWLPAGLNLTGTLHLDSEGDWIKGQPWQLTGQAKIAEGQAFWQEDDELLSVILSTAQLRWQWQQQLHSQLEIKFNQSGDISADIVLPVVAHWPFIVNKDQLLSAQLSAQLQELGLFSVLFPEWIQDSSGQLGAEVTIAGTWQQPALHGYVQLTDGQTYIPRAGLQLESINISGRIDQHSFILEKLEARSGEGFLTGEGDLQLSEWQPQSYQLQLKGHNFQLFNLPDLQAKINPELTIKGDLKSVYINGTMNIPQLYVKGQQKNNLAVNSPDLILVDADETTNKALQLQPQIDLQLELGEKAFIQIAGLDARLEGQIKIESTPQQALGAFGKINIAKGRYTSYGVNLDIDRGNLVFNGGALNQPALDILALRTIGEIKAGVQVSGTPNQPKVDLYSDPTLEDIDILSYIVLGRPVDAKGGQNSLIMSAASVLLSQGESVVLQDKLKKTFGLDVFEINAGADDTELTMITTGKYLHPDLYVSYGYSLFSDDNEITLRYTLSPHWEVKSNFGSQSGADIFFKVDIQ